MKHKLKTSSKKQTIKQNIIVKTKNKQTNRKEKRANVLFCFPLRIINFLQHEKTHGVRFGTKTKTKHYFPLSFQVGFSVFLCVCFLFFSPPFSRNMDNNVPKLQCNKQLRLSCSVQVAFIYVLNTLNLAANERAASSGTRV